MTLKISFESDIKGFERVQRALEAQGKELNQNAIAVERLNKANAGLTNNEAFNIKGMESIRGMSAHIKDLTGAMDTLVKSQTSLKGFLGIFGEFGSEINKLKNEAGTQIFKNMGDHIDVMKNNMRSASKEMASVRQEIKMAIAEGRAEDATAATTRLNTLATQQMANGSMLSSLKTSKMWHEPLVGSMSMAKMAGIARTGGMVVGGAMLAANVGSQYVSDVFKAGHLEQEKRLSQEYGIAEAAASGNIGRSLLLKHGVGEEARVARGGVSPILTKGIISNAFGLMFGTTTYDTVKREARDEANQLDKRKYAGIDMGTNFAKRLMLDPSGQHAALAMGDQGVLNAVQSAGNRLKGLPGGAIPIGEALSGLNLATEFGLQDQYSTAVASAPVRAGQISRQIITLNSGIAKSRKEVEKYKAEMEFRKPSDTAIGYSDDGLKFYQKRLNEESDKLNQQLSERTTLQQQARSDYYQDIGSIRIGGGFFTKETLPMFQRQVARTFGSGDFKGPLSYAGVSTDKFEALAKTIGVGAAGQAMDPASVEAITGFIQQQAGRYPSMSTSQNAAGGLAMSGLAAIAGDNSAMSMKEKFGAAATAQNMFEKRMGTPGSAGEQHLQAQLMKAGVTDFIAISQISDLVKNNQGERAGKYIAKLTGKSDEEGLDVINAAKDFEIEQRKKLTGFYTPEGQRREKAAAEIGIASGQHYILAGTTAGIAGSKETAKAYENMKVGAVDITNQAPIDKFEMPGSQVIASAQASQMASVTREMQEKLGKDIVLTITESISNGFITMAEEVTRGMADLPTKTTATPADNPSELTTTPVTGPRRGRIDNN